MGEKLGSVTQADRDAASEYIRARPMVSNADIIKYRGADDDALVQAFARHRTRGEDARLREALEWYAREYSWRSSSTYMCGHHGPSAAELDRGKKARAALQGDAAHTSQEKGNG